MRHLFRIVLSSIGSWRHWLPKYAIGGAWFFAITSAISLLFLILIGDGSESNSRVFGAEVNGVVHTVWGLTYSGFLGSVLLYSELIAVIVAAALTALPARFASAGPVVIRAQKIAHVYLTGWAGLWMLGVMNLATVAPGFWTLQAIFLAALFACTLYRAVREWPRWQDHADEQANDELLAQFEAIQPPQEDSPIRYRSAFNDIEEVSQYMLGREDVQLSAKVTQLFSGNRNTDPETDAYGEKIRQRAKHAWNHTRETAAKGWTHIRSRARTLASLFKAPAAPQA